MFVVVFYYKDTVIRKSSQIATFEEAKELGEKYLKEFNSNRYWYKIKAD